jgi:hypothetical protein
MLNRNAKLVSSNYGAYSCFLSFNGCVILTQFSLLRNHPALMDASLCRARKFLHTCSPFLESKMQANQDLVILMKIFSWPGKWISEM